MRATGPTGGSGRPLRIRSTAVATAVATSAPIAPAGGVPTTRFASRMPAASATATASRSGTCRSAARRPSLIHTAAPPTVRNTGSDAAALVTPSASGSSPVSAAATRVPGASAPHGTVHSPSRATTAAASGRSPSASRIGAAITAPTPNPVTDSANGVSPSTTRSTTAGRGAPVAAT